MTHHKYKNLNSLFQDSIFWLLYYGFEINYDAWTKTDDVKDIDLEQFGFKKERYTNFFSLIEEGKILIEDMPEFNNIITLKLPLNYSLIIDFRTIEINQDIEEQYLLSHTSFILPVFLGLSDYDGPTSPYNVTSAKKILKAIAKNWDNLFDFEYLYPLILKNVNCESTEDVNFVQEKLKNTFRTLHEFPENAIEILIQSRIWKVEDKVWYESEMDFQIQRSDIDIDKIKAFFTTLR